MSDDPRPDGPGSDGPARPEASPAPWLEDPEAFSIVETTFSEVRPGWFCFLREMRGFVEVSGVSVVPAQRSKVCFVDLVDGRTLSGAPDDTIFARLRR